MYSNFIVFVDPFWAVAPTIHLTSSLWKELPCVCWFVDPIWAMFPILYVTSRFWKELKLDCLRA